MATPIQPPLGPVVGGVLRLIGRSRVPQTAGTLRLDGSVQPGEVLRDRWGVPHIRAETPRDVQRVVRLPTTGCVPWLFRAHLVRDGMPFLPEHSTSL